jgi:hypothetical protein
MRAKKLIEHIINDCDIITQSLINIDYEVL